MRGVRHVIGLVIFFCLGLRALAWIVAPVVPLLLALWVVALVVGMFFSLTVRR